jgi:hypothetical protein
MKWWLVDLGIGCRLEGEFGYVGEMWFLGWSRSVVVEVK